jgi:aryl-alcohol dehydrogenase-like predicted oxidoreductase
MRKRTLGTSNLQVSELGLGCMGMSFSYGVPQDESDMISLIRSAADRGITFFDTAEVYGPFTNETLLGKALAPIRTSVVIATKFGFNLNQDGSPGWQGVNSRPEHIKQVADASLKRLQTDHIDLFQLHGYDAMTPHEEVLSTLDTLVRAGKIRYVGVSNFSGWHIAKALGVADKYGYPRYVANQTYYSLIGREYEWELMPLGLEEGIGAVVWSPLGWGRLTGKIRRGTGIPKESRLHDSSEAGPQVEDEYLFKVVDALDEVAKETGKSVPQIALNWLLQRPTVSTVVVGARNEEQLRQNLGAVGWNLTKEQIAKLDAASERPLVYPYWHQRVAFSERNPPPV